jgi:glycosyltransferase involved in cell wall biosynthesis
MAYYLQQAGHEMTIFPATFGQDRGPTVELPDSTWFVDQFEDGVRFRYVRTRPYRNAAGRFVNMFSYGRNVLRCTDALERPDVIIGSQPHPHAVEAAIRLARRFDVPLVYEIRDIWPQSLIDIKGLSPWNPVCGHFRRIERRAFRHAQGVISVLPGIEDYAGAHGIPPSRVANIPNGIDPALFPAVQDPPPAEPFVVSCFSRFGSGNAMTTIVEAAAVLADHPQGKDIRIRLAGDGPLKRPMQHRAAELRLANIDFLDPVPKKELARLAHRSHAFVHAHRIMPIVERYGMSVNKLFAFMAAGRPVVFACRSPYDPIRQARAGITVAPEDPRAMAEAMIRLRNLPEPQRADMGRRGRRFVLEHHDLSKVAERLASFLETLVSPDNRHRQDGRAA